jgi:hypothetical protein
LRWAIADFQGAGSRRARDQLMALRGKTHTLHSAVAVVAAGAVVFEHVDAAHLTMRAFSDGFLDAISMRSAAATASVGGYQLEGAGIQLFERVEGDHFTVLGLRFAAAGLAAARGTREVGKNEACSSSVSPARSRWARPRRRGCLPKRACRCTTPMRPCTSFTKAKG